MPGANNGEIHRLLETTFLKTDIKVTSPPGLISDTLFDWRRYFIRFFKMECFTTRALDILNALELKDIQVNHTGFCGIFQWSSHEPAHRITQTHY